MTWWASTVEKHEGQKTNTGLFRPRRGWSPSPTILSIMIGCGPYNSCTSKTFSHLTYIFSARGQGLFGGKRTFNFKLPSLWKPLSKYSEFQSLTVHMKLPTNPEDFVKISQGICPCGAFIHSQKTSHIWFGIMLTHTIQLRQFLAEVLLTQQKNQVMFPTTHI